MKIVIYRHLRGYCLVAETIDPMRALGSRFASAVPCHETTLEELVGAGLIDTADLIVNRRYLDLPFDVADDVIDRLNCSRELATAW